MGALVRQLRSSWTTGATLESPSNWIARTFGVQRSSAGEDVTERNVLYSADFLTCVRIIAETIAQLPLILYERQTRGKTRARGHPLYSVLADQANTEMTAYVFRETLQAHLLTWGGAYAWIEKDGADVVGLWPMLPDRTRPFRGPNGDIFYESQIQRQPIPVPGEMRIYSASEVFHIPGLSFDGLRGYSVVDLMRESIGLSIAQDKYNGRSLQNNAMPPAIITMTQNMKPDERSRFMKEWREAHQGPDKAWAIGMLAAGMDIKPLGITQRDAQFLELRKFARAVTVGFFRIPPHMLSDTEQAPSGGTGVEARSMDFARFAIQPWATRWEQQINMKLLTRNRDQRFFSEFLMDGLMRPDAAARATYYSQAFGKWMWTNDIRDKENMNPYETPEDPLKNPADVLLYPGNMGSAEQIVSGDYRVLGPSGSQVTPVEDGTMPLALPPGPGDTPGAGSQQGNDARRSLLIAHRPAIRDIADRILRREMADLGKRSYKDPEAVYADHADYIVRQMLPALETIAATVALDVTRETGREASVPATFIRSYVGSYAKRHTQASLAEVRRLIESGNDMKEAMASWPKRAEFVAVHESIRAGNAFAREAYRTAGVKSLVWSAGDECAECQRLQGQVVDMGEVFARGLGHPPLCEECACVLMAATERQERNTREDKLMSKLEVVDGHVKDTEMKPEERALMMAIAERLSKMEPPQQRDTTLVVPKDAFNINITTPPVRVDAPITVEIPAYDTQFNYDRNGKITGTKKVRI